jgi:uncharacterized repeat protein (TIGR01451 family)
MTHPFSPGYRRTTSGVIAALAVIVLAVTPAGAQKVGVNCLADGGTDCTELIPDGSGFLMSSVTVPAGGCASVARVCVALGVEHSEMSDLTITLNHNATSIPISGGTSPDLRTGQIFETEFDGQNGAGTWTLQIGDSIHGDYGGLNNWVLGLCCGADCGSGLVRVNPTSGLVTTESGGTAQFSVELTCPPFHEVTIPGIASSDTTEGLANVSSLLFNAGNWSMAQNVMSTGQDDPLLDGDIPYSIPLGAAVLGAAFNVLQPADLYNPPSLYGGVDPADVGLVNLDNETDLSITKELVTVGPPVRYTITATNEAPGAVMGATVTDIFSLGLTCSWTCVGTGGGTCTPGPVAGSISDTVNLPPGASVTYSVTCTAAPGASLVNTATIAPPSGVTDRDGSDNSDTVEPAAPPVAAPAPALSLWGMALALLAIAFVARRQFARAKGRTATDQ